MIQSLRDLLVVSDMDGTLLDDSKVLLPCNLEIIRLFTALGGRFTVATGRLFESVSRYPELLEFMEPAITAGGCVLYDFRSQTPVKTELLPRMIAHQVMQDVQAVFPQLGVLVAGNDTRFYQVAASPAAQRLLEEETASFYVRDREFLPDDWHKVLFAGPGGLMGEVLEFLQQRGYPGVAFVATERHYVEMMPQGVTKGSALLELCRLLDVPVENTVAIGDYYNDIDLMRTAGVSVAMANAPGEVKMEAQTVTGHCNEGGVGQYLFSLIRKYA